MVRRTRVAFRQQQATLGALNGLIEETITGQRVVKAYGREAAVMGQFDAANQAFRRRGDPGPDLRRLHGAADQRRQQHRAGDHRHAWAAGW